MTPSLRLASNSPRRRQLLALAGVPFFVRPVEIDETPLPGESSAQYVLRLAESKARAALSDAHSEELILSADTTVAANFPGGDRILGKPAGAQEAREMLASLRARAHFVYTAIGIADPASGRIITDLCATQVWMRDYTDEEMEAYIASGDPFDKAGAYAIQNESFHPVERIEGCFASVMGLPVCHVVRALKTFHLVPVSTTALACQEYLTLTSPCPVYEQILSGQAGG